MNKLLVITGPTATGKTVLAIKLAKKFNGEIISADSRQVYKYMDIGTGKDKEQYEKAGVKIWGIDLVEPDYNFNVSDYLVYVSALLRKLWDENRLPIIVGGTVLYIKALLEPFETIAIPPDQSLREKLANYPINRLQKELQKLDTNRWKRMNESDRSNPRRLVRAIEVVLTGNRSNSMLSPKNGLIFHFDGLIISLHAPLKEIYRRIDCRVDKRVEQGIIREVQSLLDKGYSWDLPSFSASGYREFKDYFENLPATSYQLLDTCISRWKFNEHAYARRQVSFIKKFLQEQGQQGSKIVTANIEEGAWQEGVFDKIEEWYHNNNVPAEN